MSESFQEINILNKPLPFFRKQQELNKGLALVDLDGTIRATISGKKFIDNDFKDQQLITDIDKILELLNYLGYTVIGVSNQGGILAQYKTLRNTIKEMRYCLNLCSYLDKIYFAVNDSEVWVITRNLPFLDVCPLSWGTFSRYPIYGGIGDSPKNFYGGFRKPNSGMLKLAIADWVNRYDLRLETIKSKDWLIKMMATADEYQKSFKDLTLSEQLRLPIFMTGDRDEDAQAAKAARIDFIEAEKFQKGFIIN